MLICFFCFFYSELNLHFTEMGQLFLEEEATHIPWTLHTLT